MFVAAAAAPPEGGRHGGRFLQLRVITLGGRTDCESSTAVHMPWTPVACRRVIALRRTAAGGAPFMHLQLQFLLVPLAEAPAGGRRPRQRSSGLLLRPLLAFARAEHLPHVACSLSNSRLWRANRTIVLRRIIVRAGTMLANLIFFSVNARTQAASGRPLSRPSRFVLARSFKGHAFATRCQSIWGRFHRLRLTEVTC